MALVDVFGPKTATWAPLVIEEEGREGTRRHSDAARAAELVRRPRRAPARRVSDSAKRVMSRSSAAAGVCRVMSRSSSLDAGAGGGTGAAAGAGAPQGAGSSILRVASAQWRKIVEDGHAQRDRRAGVDDLASQHARVDRDRASQNVQKQNSKGRGQISPSVSLSMPDIAARRRRSGPLGIYP